MNSTLAAIGSAVVSIQRACDTMDRKLDTVLRRVTDLELYQQRLESKVDQLLNRQQQVALIPQIQAEGDDIQPAIPDIYTIAPTDITSMMESAKSCGNFAAALTKRFSPELFGHENLRYFYNWNGGGPQKNPGLDPARKEIRQYTMQMYPEMRRDDIFQSSVINSVNELLCL